jgi:putative ATP-binding cassette transporter
VKVSPGERVLIVGETGAGKSTLFRAIAGIWQWGAGTILTPPVDSMAFLPQRPYLPLGTLRYVLTYPAAAKDFSDHDVRAALDRCRLSNLIERLDEAARWDKELSLGQQQRLAFVRLILHKPSWVFLDEATSALDQESQHCVMTLFDEELKNSTLLSIGHRPDLSEYHERTLQLAHDSAGDRLHLKPRAAVKPPPRWLRRATKWMPRPAATSA